MPTLLNLPTEILCQVFQLSDNFPDVLAFASVCKQLHMTWVANQGNIIWAIGRHLVLSFDEALIAVSQVLGVSCQWKTY